MKELLLLAFAVLVVSRCTFTAMNLLEVQIDGFVYVRSNGLVEGTDRIISSDNVTYTFADDIDNSIIVERDNIIIEGAGHSLVGSGVYGSVGIDLHSRFNVTIKNLSITTFGKCISLNSSFGCLIFGNRFATAKIGTGIVIQDSSENVVSGNQIEENNEGIRMRGDSQYNSVKQNYLTSNVFGLTLCCPNNNISGNVIASHSACGLHAFATNNITITANSVVNNRNQSEHGAWGILIRGCNNSVIVENNVTDNEIPFEMHDSSNNTISRNNIAHNTGSFHFDGSGHNVSGNNFLNNTNYGLIAALVANCTISGNNFDRNTVVGINVDEGENITIAENIITNTKKDITGRAHPLELLNLSRCCVSKNNVSNNADCVKIHLCTDSVFHGNNITHNDGPGLYISISSNCTFSENCILNNSDAGIKIWYCNTSSFVGNRVESCGVGISLSYSSGNRIFHNNFVNNTEHANMTGSTNYWDNGYPSGGNFWSDYTDRYPEALELDDSGLWNTPYMIDEYNQDNYPIISEFSFLLFSIMFTVTTLTAVTFVRMDRCAFHKKKN